MKIRIDDLNEYLISHKKEIDIVILQWTFNPNYAETETNNFGIDKDGHQFGLYARFSYNVNDLEYSFAGTIEEAIEWTKCYTHWDGCEFIIEDGILTGEYDSYHGDADEYPEDLEDLTHEESTDIKYDGLYYYGNDHRAYPYHGDVFRNCDEEDDDE